MISSLIPSVKIQIIGGNVYLRQNIAEWWQQTFCFQKFVDNAQQCFAFTPQANSPGHNLNFQVKGDEIDSRLPFKIFCNLKLQAFWLWSVPQASPMASIYLSWMLRLYGLNVKKYLLKYFRNFCVTSEIFWTRCGCSVSSKVRDWKVIRPH